MHDTLSANETDGSDRTIGATFLIFRPSGKYYTEGRGVINRATFLERDRHHRRLQILSLNGGLCPGLSGTGEDYIWIVTPDEGSDFGYPLCLLPED